MIKLTCLDREQALLYMAHRGGEIGAVVAEYLDECEKRLLDVISPKYTYKIFGITSSAPVTLDCGLVLPGRDIASHFAGCTACAVFCVTLGTGVDKLIRRLEVEDMAKAVITDAYASAAAEQAADMVDGLIQQSLKDRYFTWRYSPGYGDLPLDMQRDILDIINAPKITGVCTGTGNMLAPIKSVTALTGISEEPIEQKRRGCVVCQAHDFCELRKKGLHCGFKENT